MAFSGVNDLEHGLAGALEQALAGLGNAAALQGRTAAEGSGEHETLAAMYYHETYRIERGRTYEN